LIGEEKVQVVCFYPMHYDTKILGPDNAGRTVTGLQIRKKLESYKSGLVIPVDFEEKYWFDDFENDVKEIMRDQMRDLYRKLEAEYEWLTSDEEIGEMFRNHEYEFTIDGEIL